MLKIIEVPDKPLFIVPIAIPGSGKSTLLKEAINLDFQAVMGLDDLRVFTFGTRTVQGSTYLPQALTLLVRERISRGLDVAYDNTNVKSVYRMAVLEALSDLEVHSVALLSAVTFDTASQRNAKRPKHQRVPQKVLEDMQRHLDDSRSVASLFEEGFDQVEVWDDKINAFEFTRFKNPA